MSGEPMHSASKGSKHYASLSVTFNPRLTHYTEVQIKNY